MTPRRRAGASIALIKMRLEEIKVLMPLDQKSHFDFFSKKYLTRRQKKAQKGVFYTHKHPSN
jgi:hypothetical protein